MRLRPNGCNCVVDSGDAILHGNHHIDIARIGRQHPPTVRERPSIGWDGSLVSGQDRRSLLVGARDYSLSRQDWREISGGHMKVLQVITDRDRRGAQVFATDLAAGLVEIGADVETVALTRGTHGDLLDIDVLGPSRRSPATLRALRRSARQSDIVIAHGSATLFACAVALLGSRRPFVYRQISDPQHWAASLPRRLRIAVFLRRAAGIVVLSPSIATVFGHHYRMKPDHLTVIPNAVPGNAFSPATPLQKAGALEAFGLPKDSVVVAYIGALATEKGVDMAIEAVAEADHCHLLVVGDGPERELLNELADRRAPNRVTFTGSLSDPKAAFAAADLLVLPSRGGDSMPAVLIEAGLCHLSCVTTPVGAIADVVLGGHTGRVVPIGDQQAFTAAVRELAADETLRHEYGLAASEHCRANFTIAATAPAWLELFSSLVR
ncbi:MAG: glycosyltransferase family 4 protein [Ilumatobacteraceae bacterium]